MSTHQPTPNQPPSSYVQQFDALVRIIQLASSVRKDHAANDELLGEVSSLCDTLTHPGTDSHRSFLSWLAESLSAPNTGEEVELPQTLIPHDTVKHPRHYNAHPSGVECITITKHMGFCLGNAIKYIWRADLKGNAIEDLRKAAEYISIEIERREAVTRKGFTDGNY